MVNCGLSPADGPSNVVEEPFDYNGALFNDNNEEHHHASSHAQQHYEIIKPALQAKSSRERGKVVRSIINKTGLHRSTVYKYIQAYEEYGIIGLERQERSDQGVARIVLSRKWDRTFLATGIISWARAQAIVAQIKRKIDQGHINSVPEAEEMVLTLTENALRTKLTPEQQQACLLPASYISYVQRTNGGTAQ